MNKPMKTLEAASLAARFFEELSGEFETLGDVAQTHGLVTLTDLMYLHNAILIGGFIDCWPASAVSEVVQRLPSGGMWVTYTRKVDASGIPRAHPTRNNVAPPIMPRVLVTVSGGVAEYRADPGVDVVIIDHDNEEADGGKGGGVPARLRDLMEERTPSVR